MASAFARATAVRAQGDGRYAAAVDPAWAGGAGPNGGYLAALVLRALIAEVDDAARPPRSLGLQFLSSPGPGPISIDVAVRKAGRNASFLGATLSQDGRARVMAQAAFVVATEALVDYDDAPMPAVAPPAELAPLVLDDAVRPALFDHLDLRPAIGPPPLSGAGASLTGGWLRLVDPHPADAPALCLYADGWLPSPTSRLHAPAPVPTLDYTVYFRHPAPAGAGEPVLARFSSACSFEGLYEEDALLWSRDGTLLAQSRQLGLLR